MQLCFFIVIANGIVFFQGWEGKIMTGSIPNYLVGIINPTKAGKILSRTIIYPVYSGQILSSDMRL